MIKAPICLFVYNRPQYTLRTIECLKNNYLACDSELFVFSDGVRNAYDIDKVKMVRNLIRKVDGFKKITVVERDSNLGLANSIISGVTYVLKGFGKAIVLEDDLVTTRNFLNFMNDSLAEFEHQSNVLSTSGWSMDIKCASTMKGDCYSYPRPASWGWATWLDRWERVEWNRDFYQKLLVNNSLVRGIRKNGSDIPRMLRKYLDGANDSWAIRFTYHQFINKMTTIYPKYSFVENIGIGRDSTHTKGGIDFNPSVLMNEVQCNFDFQINEIDNGCISDEVRRKFGIGARILRKLRG